MAGKNRIMVNFSSKRLKDVIAKIAAENHISQSKAIEKLVSFRLFEGNGDPVVDAFSKASKSVVEQQQQSDDEFHIALNTPYIKHSVRLYMADGHISESGSLKFKPDECGELNVSIIEKEIKKVINDHIEKLKPNEWVRVFGDETLIFADLWLVFINEIIVEYKCVRPESCDGVIYIDFRAKNIRCIPFTFNKNDFLGKRYCNAMEHLDFNSVEYRTFKSVATKGWNRNKHSHLLYIGRASDSVKGGFFIGVQYEENDKKFTKQSPMSPLSPPEGVLPNAVNARYSEINPELKINIYHIPGSFKIRNLTPTLESNINKG
ncbi:hypothetical protein QPK14_06400 [Photorhabdus temperata subsp. temperata]